MLTSCARTPIGVRPAAMATPVPVTIVDTYGVRQRGCSRRAAAGSSPSLLIAKKIRDCPSIVTSITDVSPASAPISTSQRIAVSRTSPRSRRTGRGMLQRQHHRRGRITHLRVRGQADHHQRHGHVEDRADRERAEQPDRHVALRIARVLGGGGDRVEADEGEEHDRGAAGDAADTRTRRTARCWVAGTVASTRDDERRRRRARRRR